MAVAPNFWAYVGLALRKWTSMVVAGAGLIGFLAKLAYPTLPLPQWVYLAVAIAGVIWAGYQVYRDVAPPRSPPPPPYELLPRSFEIYLGASPRIQVWLYAANYTARELEIDLLELAGFRLSGCDSLDPISPEGEIRIPPKQSRLIMCHRRLMEAEARNIAASRPGFPANATFSVTSRAIVGSKRLRWDNTQLSLNGSVQGGVQAAPTIG